MRLRVRYGQLVLLPVVRITLQPPAPPSPPRPPPMERFLWHPASASDVWLFKRRNAVAQLRGHQDDHECNKVHDEDEKQYNLHAAHVHPQCAIAEMSEATVSGGDGWCEDTSATSLSLRAAEHCKSPPLFGNPATSSPEVRGFALPPRDGFAFIAATLSTQLQ